MEREDLFPVLIDLLNTFDVFCYEHNLRYFLFAGSLLGAIRHQGIIPWDDDVDVCMPREDYEKLISLNDRFKEPYFLQSISFDHGYNKTFIKLRNSMTTEIPHKDAVFNFNHGVFIDIFPLDNVCDSERLLHRQLQELKMIEGLIHFHSRFYSGIKDTGLSGKKKIAYKLIELTFRMKLLSPERLDKIHKSIACRYNKKETSRVGTIVFSYDNERFIYPTNYFKNLMRTRFETIECNIPNDYDQVLHICYGDYMTPSKQPSEHGDVIFDAKVPYNKYVAANKDNLISIWKQYHG